MDKNNVIHEKQISETKNIPIDTENINRNNYEIKSNILDPNKSSPPNFFLQKLIIRLNNLQQTNIEKRF